MPAHALDGLTILVTRPEHQADKLCRLVEEAGGRALRLPLLHISDTSDSDPVRAITGHLADYDLAIFISPNAVSYGLAAIKANGGLPATLTIATVGKGSARTLHKLSGRHPDLVPDGRFDSEALLELAPLQQMAGKRVVIFRGNGGRETLAETLRARGARVDYAEVYRRDCPPPLEDRDDRIDNADIIVVTSSGALENLFHITAGAQRPTLLTIPLLLVSERAMERAHELGFRAEHLLSPRAEDEAILATLTSWAEDAPPTTTEKNNE